MQTACLDIVCACSTIVKVSASTLLSRMNAPDPVSMTSESRQTDAALRRVLRADLLDFTADPGFALPDEASGVRWRPDHLVLIEDGRIHAVQPANQPLPAGGRPSPRKTTAVAC